MKLTKKNIQCRLKLEPCGDAFNVCIKWRTKRIGLLQIVKSSADRCYIAAIDVLPVWQRQGIATEMMRLAVETLAKMGVTTMGAAIEGSGVIQILESVIGPGKTAYRAGRHRLTTKDAIAHVDKHFGRLISESTLDETYRNLRNHGFHSNQPAAG